MVNVYILLGILQLYMKLTNNEKKTVFLCILVHIFPDVKISSIAKYNLS